MSMGPLGAAGGVAGSPFAQRTGSDVEKNVQQADHQKRRTDTDEKAEQAAGIGETDGEDQFTSERDADGRRLWEPPPDSPEEAAEEVTGTETPSPGRGRDASGTSGKSLDLSA